MHYYKRNLGDYAKKAGRLSMLQHGSYTLLIDACYDRELFPTLEQAIEWTWASTTDEIEAVTFVLKRFFTLEGDVYVQTRIREEIAEYHGKSEINKRIALEREAKRKAEDTERARTVDDSSPPPHEPPPNHKPRTTNQEPGKKTVATSVALPDGVLQQTWDDFLRIRKAKRAPMTQTALDLINREADKAGMTLQEVLAMCCQRGWQGFQASWVAGSRGGQQLNRQETLEAHNQDVADRWLAKQGENFDPV